MIEFQNQIKKGLDESFKGGGMEAVAEFSEDATGEENKSDKV